MLTCMSGAVTALGDTVFPTQPALNASLLSTIRADASPSQHFLVRLRVLHPLVAVCAALLVAGVLLGIVTGRTPAAPAQYQLATLAFSAVILQTGVGFVNVLLAAPGCCRSCTSPWPRRCGFPPGWCGSPRAAAEPRRATAGAKTGAGKTAQRERFLVCILLILRSRPLQPERFPVLERALRPPTPAPPIPPLDERPRLVGDTLFFQCRRSRRVLHPHHRPGQPRHGAGRCALARPETAENVPCQPRVSPQSTGRHAARGSRASS